MSTWVGCEMCHDFWKGEVGDKCIACGKPAKATPLFPTKPKEYPPEFFLVLHQERLLVKVFLRKVKDAEERMGKMKHVQDKLLAGAFERLRERIAADLFNTTVALWRANKDLRKIDNDA